MSPESVQTTLLRSVSKWLLNQTCKFNEFIENRLENLLQHCQALEDTNEIQLMTKVTHQIMTLKVILPFVIASLIETGDIVENFDPDSVLLDNDTESLIAYLSKEWYQSWPQIEWFKSKWLHIIIQAASKVSECSPQSRDIIDIYIELFSNVFNYVGKVFVQEQFCPIFNQYLPPPSLETSQEFSVQEIKVYESCILPIYVQGVLVKIDAPHDIADKLHELAVAYNNSNLRTSSLSLAIELLVKNNLEAGVHDAIAEMAWTMLVHTNSKVKIMASLTLKYLAIVQGEGDLIGHKILPGLVTLSSDLDPEVRASSLIGTLYEYDICLLAIICTYINNFEKCFLVYPILR